MKHVLLEEFLQTGHLEDFTVGYLNNDQTMLDSLWYRKAKKVDFSLKHSLFM